MSRTVDEWMKVRPRAQADITPAIRSIAQEAVRLSALTGNEHFDWYNRHLEAAIKAERRNSERFVAIMRSPMSSAEDAEKARAGLILSDCRTSVFEEVLMLPKFLLENAQKARGQIEEMERATSVRLTA